MGIHPIRLGWILYNYIVTAKERHRIWIMTKVVGRFGERRTQFFLWLL